MPVQHHSHRHDFHPVLNFCKKCGAAGLDVAAGRVSHSCPGRPPTLRRAHFVDLMRGPIWGTDRDRRKV
jgi:hypothetical protein